MAIISSILGFIGKFFLVGIIITIAFGIYFVFFNKDEDKIETDDQIPELDKSPYIDLGLSVKWASCNLGASNPWNYGDHYAWGETETKKVYDNKTYKWYVKRHLWSKQEEDADYENIKVKKYSVEEDKPDRIVNLLQEDDVATQKLGNPWRMPTEKEIVELTYLCKWTPTTIHGNTGFLVVSRINGNSIFLPATGIRHDTSSDTWISERTGGYLSKRLFSDFRALGITLYKNHTYSLGALKRIYGYAVRPVHP